MPAGYSRTALSAHSLTIAYSQMCPGFHRTAVIRVRAFTVLLLYVSGLSPYCCYTCPGFHRTAVIRVRAFTVLLLYVSGLSLYCCYTCPGFHRTAVIRVRAFTVLLLYVSGLSLYCCFIPIWTIHEQVSPWSSLTIRRTQSPNNAYICLSQDRSNNWTQTGSPVSLTHTSADIAQATHAHVTIRLKLINNIW